MRRGAYMTALEEAAELPTRIPRLSGYFNDNYNPRNLAISHIKTAARLDVQGLFDRELKDILDFNVESYLKGKQCR